MKNALRLLSMLVGIIFIAAAVVQWATFEYPDANPIWPGAIFTPGIGSQVLNWLVVSTIGGVGVGLISLGRSKPKSDTTDRWEP